MFILKKGVDFPRILLYSKKGLSGSDTEMNIYLCASGSEVEYRLAKARVAGSNPVSRFLL